MGYDMDTAARFAPTLGRLLLGVFFLLAGINKLSGDIAGLAGYIESGGLPGILAWPTIVFEIAVGAALILGWQTRIAALAGAAFCVATAVLYHYNPADQMQMISFMKNIAIAGGFLALVGSGPGALALGRA
jgi:putative oxidoreductase